MDTQLTNPIATVPFTLEYGDYFGSGLEFWLQSRCLLGVVAGSAPGGLGSDTVPLAKACAEALLTRLHRPSRFNPQGFTAFTAKKWAAGRLITSVLSGTTSANPAEAASLAVGHALTIAGKCGESMISPVFRMADYQRSEGYLLSVPLRRAVLLFEGWLRDSSGLSEAKVQDLADLAVAKSNFLGWAQPQHWLVRATPWLACQGRTPEFLYWLLATTSILEKSAPDNWVAQQMMIAVVAGLSVDSSQTPGAMVLHAMRLAKALEAASEQTGSPTTDPAYCWLATTALAELVRASQAQWSPEEMAEAAEAAVKVTTDFLQVINQ